MTDLILLHGGQHGSWCWAALIEALAQRAPSFARIITLDMPGCGTKRGRAVAELSLADIVSELNDELRDRGVQGATLLGHSIAGVLLPMMAAEDPTLFGQLIYLATAIPEQGQTIMQLLGNSRHGEREDQVGWPLDLLTTPPEEMAKAMFGAGLSEAQLAWLLAEVSQETTPPAVVVQPADRTGYPLDMPATYILTLRDDILPPVWQRRFAERLGVGAVVEIDTPHEPFVSHPQVLAEVMLDLLATESVQGEPPRL